jgi:hypothetical protein
MLNRRLYLQAWLVAFVALVVAFLTLQPPEEPVPGDQFATFNASEAAKGSAAMAAAAPLRVPGTAGGEAAAAWVEAELRKLPSGDRLVATQEVSARVEGRPASLRNVFFTLPASAVTRSPRNILIVAPRDAPRGVTTGTSNSAMLVELARNLTQRANRRHTMIFLSTDGSSLGNAGMRWYLSRVERSLIAGVIVLDAPGDGAADEVHVWASGGSRQALFLRGLAEQAIAQAGFRADPVPSLRTQLVRLAVPETRGEQRAAIDRAVPAVTLSGRDEGPLPAGTPEADRDRMDAVGTAVLALTALLDERERANVPDASLAFADRILRPSVVRVALLLLALPLLVMALDAAARVRRARVRLSSGLRAVAWRFVPPLAVLLVAHALAMWGVLRGPDVGRPPPPRDLPFGRMEVLIVVALALLSVVLGWVVRPRLARTGAQPPEDAAGALVWLALITLLAWWLAPFALVLILPAAHAALAATVVQHRWQVAILAAVGLVVPVAVIVKTAVDIDRNPLFAIWYLCQTSVSGARGMLGPILAVLVGVCVVSLGTLVMFRARKGLVGRRPRPARPVMSRDR